MNCDEAHKGECRKESPSAHGWPKTKASDWCCVWFVDARPKPTGKRLSQDLNRLGINYVFVRDYPELVATWLAAVMTVPENVPVELLQMLERPLDNLQTDKMPDMLDGEGVCCENLLLWAERIEGFCNSGDDDEYVGLLMMDDDPAMAAASLEALTSLPLDHPWRAHVGVFPKAAPRRRKTVATDSNIAQQA